MKVAAVQILGYDKTDVPRPGFDPSEAVVRYVERAAKDGSRLVAFPEYLLGRITVPGPQTERIAKAAAAGRIYVVVGDHAGALDTLEPLLRLPYYLSPGWLRVDPNFAALKGNPRFEKLLRQ